MSTTLSVSGRGLGPIIGVHAGLLVGGGIALSLDPPAQGWGVFVWVVACVAALAVSTFYLGALVLAHFVIDVAGWRLTF